MREPSSQEVASRPVEGRAYRPTACFHEFGRCGTSGEHLYQLTSQPEYEVRAIMDGRYSQGLHSGHETSINSQAHDVEASFCCVTFSSVRRHHGLLAWLIDLTEETFRSRQPVVCTTGMHGTRSTSASSSIRCRQCVFNLLTDQSIV